MAGLATISANSEEGFSDPVYSAPLPAALVEVGFDQAKWRALLAECNQHVKFEWGLIGVGCLLGVLPGMCCFLANMHQTGIASRMKPFCDRVNAEGVLLPANVRMEYAFVTEKKLVQAGGGQGATLESYHRLTFYASV
jgi:hypothetical protein